MNKAIVWIFAASALVGCGGGNDHSSTPPPATTPPVTPPVTPPTPTPPPPAVQVLSSPIVRHAAKNTGLSFELAAKPNFTPAGTLFATASDAAGIMQAPVVVTANSDGSYAFTVDTVQALQPGSYKGDITLKLCSDAACATPQAVASIAVPYDITVAAAGSAWPGDKLTALTAWTGVADWSTFQGNAGHTGHVAADLNPDNFSLRWKTGPINSGANSGYAYANSATLTTAKGVFYSAANNQLKARSEFDGALVWSYDVSGLQYPAVSPPAVVDGVVYMMAGQQSSSFMLALDAANGALRFKTPLPYLYDSFLAPTPLGGGVYASGGSYNGMFGFNASGERQPFALQTSSSVWTPAVDATTVYAYTGDALTLYDVKSGLLASTIKDLGEGGYSYQINGAPVLGAPGTVFAARYANASASFSSAGNFLLKFNTAKGFIDWRIAGAYPVTPAYAGGVLYAPNLNPYRVEARAETDGAVLWSWTPPQAGDVSWSSEPIVTNNLMFISSNSTTFAVDLRTRKTVWSYPLAGRLALSQSGVLYIQSLEALVAVTVK